MKSDVKVKAENIASGLKETFESHKDVRFLYGIGDGNYFFKKSAANDYAKSIGSEQKVVEYKR